MSSSASKPSEPAVAHRQTAEEVRGWCEQAGFEVEHEHVQDAGITMITRKTAPSGHASR